MNETPRTIKEWINSVIPNPNIDKQLIKLQEEVTELVQARAKNDLDNFIEELADVLIISLGIAGLSGIQIQKEINRKMKINRQRKWKLKPNGVYQHVES